MKGYIKMFGAQRTLSRMDNKYGYRKVNQITPRDSIGPRAMLRNRRFLDGQRKPKEDRTHKSLENFFQGGGHARRIQERNHVWDPSTGRTHKNRDWYSNN